MYMYIYIYVYMCKIKLNIYIMYGIISQAFAELRPLSGDLSEYLQRKPNGCWATC